MIPRWQMFVYVIFTALLFSLVGRVIEAHAQQNQDQVRCQGQEVKIVEDIVRTLP